MVTKSKTTLVGLFMISAIDSNFFLSCSISSSTKIEHKGNLKEKKKYKMLWHFTRLYLTWILSDVDKLL